MADSKITALDTLAAAPAAGDYFVVVDVSDTTMSVNGTNKKITATYLLTDAALLAGRAGGQTLYGGTAANEDIIIHGTSHATKTSSYVILQPGGGQVVVGASSPISAATLDIAGSLGVSGAITAARVRAETTAINDDAVAIITPGVTRGTLIITTGSLDGESGIFTYRAESTPYCTSLAIGSVTNATTGVLSGTTGTDGRLTVSAHSDGKIYIENRRGGARSVTYTILG